MAAKRGTPKATSKKSRQNTINSMLIENFTELQKAFTNMAVKIDNLTEQTSKLLQLFELSAKTFVEKIPGTISEMEKDKEFLDKIDKLLDQNKLVAKSLILMEQKLRERISAPQQVARPKQFQTQPTQQYQQFPPSQGYIPSQASKPKTLELN